jgi:hypothetical protein
MIDKNPIPGHFSTTSLVLWRLSELEIGPPASDARFVQATARVSKVASSKLCDSLLGRYQRATLEQLCGFALLIVFAGLIRMPQMDERQIPEGPARQGLRSLPKFVVFTAPPYERFIKAAEVTICFAGNGYAASQGILHY